MNICRWLLPLLLISTPAVGGTWREATTPHFQILSDGPEKSLVKFAGRLEKLDQLLRFLCGVTKESSPVRIKVLMLRDEEEVRRIAGRPRSNLMGFYTAPLAGPFMVVARATSESQWDAKSEEILYHEYTHHFMSQFGSASYPRWYSEGFAEYVAPTKFREKGHVEFGQIVMNRVPTLVQEKWLPMETLMTGDPDKLTHDQELMLYAEGWLLVHYLSADPERSKALRDYLIRLNKGETQLEAVKAAFGTDFAGLDEQLRDYYSKGKLYYRKINGIDFPDLSVAVRILSQAEGDMAKFDYWTKMAQPDDDEETKAFIDAIRKATKGIETTAAQIVHARGELVAGEIQMAKELIGGVLKAAPENRDAQILLGEIAIAQAEEESDPKIAAATVQETRPAIVRANRGNPDDPVPLFLYYRTFQVQGALPTQVAKAGLLRANELLPQDRRIAFEAAKILIDERQYDVAKQILLPIANSSHDKGAADSARRMMKWADENANDDKQENDTKPPAKKPGK